MLDHRKDLYSLAHIKLLHIGTETISYIEKMISADKSNSMGMSLFVSLCL